MAPNQINGGTQVQDASITNVKLAGSIADNKLASTFIKPTGANPFTANQSVGGFKFTNTADATADTDVPSWGQVKALSTSRDWKDEADVATTAAGTLASSFQNGSTIDGQTLQTGWRILIKDQASAAENGLYTVNASGAPTRATDADSSAEVTAGMQVPVVRGTLNGGTVWLLTTTGAITLGTTGLTFVQTGEQLTVDTSLVRNGHQLQRAALTGDVTASAGSNATTIANGAVSLAKMANLAANSVIANNTGSSATPTALGLTSAATVSTAMVRDGNANVRTNNLIENFQTIATAAGTTTLTVGSPRVTQFTGSTTQTVTLPDATTLVVGQAFTITNRSTGAVTVNANGGSLLQTMAAGSFLTATVTAIGTSAGSWDIAYTSTAAGGDASTNTSTSVDSEVALFSGTGGKTLKRATGTGLAKLSSGVLGTATPGTDYMGPSNFVVRETPSGSVNGSNTTFTLAYTPIPGTEQVYLNGLLQEPGAGNDYTISGATITYLTAPSGTGPDKIRVSYYK